MSLKDQIRAEMLKAQKEGEVKLLGAVKLLWSEIGYLEVDKKTGDEEIVKLLKRESKKRKEAAEIYGKAGEKKREEQERFELSVIEKYLPEEMGEKEVRKKIGELASKSGLKGGPLIGMAMKSLGDTANGQMVAKIVQENHA